MNPVTIPFTEVNSTDLTISEWSVAEGATVKAGQVLGQAETSKAIYEILCPADGVIGLCLAQSQTGTFQKPLAFVFESQAALESWKRESAAAAKEIPPAGACNATAKARGLAEKHSIDLAALADGGRLITQKMVEVEIERLREAQIQAHRPVLSPLPAEPGSRRIAIIGAGLGATQVLDILAHDRAQCAVAIFDDNPQTWNTTAHGLPVVGGSERLGELFGASTFDAAIVAISTSVPARTKFRLLCATLGIPLANAIDPSCRIATDVKMGLGNVLNAFCFIGTGSTVGDNNFFSAFNSVDHHCQVGSDLSTGPGCMVSGIVKLGDAIRMGTGVFIQPYLEIGEQVQIASGAVVVGNVPARHAIKTKIITTQTSPLR